MPAGSFAHKIKVGGAVGTYRTYRPASLPAGAPIVVMLHPSGGSARQTERDYHWDAEADSGHFVVAYPDWGEYAGANQIDFIPAIVAAIERHNPIDSSRVYAAGISLGGTEAYWLVCSTKIFAAIGVDSARELATCDRPAPISVIHIHGTADHIVPYHQPSLSGIPQLNATWRRIDHCGAPAVTTAGAVTTSIAACPAGRAVELVTIAAQAINGQEEHPAPAWATRRQRPSTPRRSSGSSSRSITANPRLPDDLCRRHVNTDPIVLTHARALLTSTPGGKTAYADADLNDPAAILRTPQVRETLDLGKPVALSLIAILMFIPDPKEERRIIDTLVDALPSGSALALSTGTHDSLSEEGRAIAEDYNASGIPIRASKKAEVEELFRGLDLVDPGVTLVHRWRPDELTPRVSDDQVAMYGGLALKP